MLRRFSARHSRIASLMFSNASARVRPWLKHPGIEHAVQFPGISINGFVNKPNTAVIFFGLLVHQTKHTCASLAALGIVNSGGSRTRKALRRVRAV